MQDGEDFTGLRAYQSGDALARISWKPWRVVRACTPRNSARRSPRVCGSTGMRLHHMLPKHGLA